MTRSIRTGRLLLVCGLIFAALSGVGAAERDTKAREEWMAGYVKLEEGGRAEEAGDTGLALSLYREALAAFQEVRRKYPSWNPSLLGYRVNFCNQRIRRLESQLDSATVEMSQEELAKVASRQVEDIRRLTEENRQLKEKLALTAEALERARRESARTVSAAEDVKSLVNECTDLKNRNAVQQQQIEQLSAEVKTLRSKAGLEEVAEKLKQEFERTQAREAQLEKAFDTYRKAYENVKERLKQATIDREKLIRLGRDLKDQADKAVKTAEQAETDAARLKQKIAELEVRHTQDADALTEKESRIGQLQDEMARLKHELRGLREWREEQVEEIEERQALVNQIQRLMRQRTETEQKTAALQTRLADARTRITDLQSESERREEAHRTEIAEMRLATEALRAKLDARPQDQTDSRDAHETQAGLTAAEGEKLRELLRQVNEDLREQIAQKEEAARRAETLARELDAVRQRLTDANDRVGKQEELIRAQGQELANVKAMSTMLETKERTLEQQNRELAEAREETARQKAALTATRQREREAKAELATVQNQLRGLEKRNVQLASAVQNLTRRTEDAQRRKATSGERLEETRELLEAVETERDALRQKSTEQLAMLKRQEQDLRRLEEQMKEKESRSTQLEKQLNDLQSRIRDQESSFEERVASMKAKTEVVDGLTASLADADAELDESRRRLAVARQEKAALESRFAESLSELKDARQEIKRYQKAISTDVSARENVLMDQISDLTSRLERETEKRRALEKAISALSVPAAPERDEAAPRLDVSIESESARRERERRALVRGYLRQAVAAEESDKIEAARWNYRKVLEHNDSMKLPVQRLGLIAADHGDDAEAIRYLRRAFKLDPDDLDTVIPLGFALMREQEPDLALSMLSRAVALEPDNPVAHRCLGIACSSLGWYDAAEVQFRRAIDIDAGDGGAAFNLAVLLATREPARLDEARTWYKKALEHGVARDPGLDRLFKVEDPDPADSELPSAP